MGAVVVRVFIDIATIVAHGYTYIETEIKEDIYLDDFADEIDQWVIDILKGIGCDTAKQVLRLTREELIERTDLEEETIDNIIKVLKTEFEK